MSFGAPIPALEFFQVNATAAARPSLRRLRSGKPPKGYAGGKPFNNNEGLLPKTDEDGNPITYEEWDVNPLPQDGADRGKERLLIGSDGRAGYTDDHYHTFVRVPG